MKIIGLTGGIGCGKTTVSDAFEALGVPVIDADRIAHAISEPDAPGWQAIVEKWGSRFLSPDNTLDRVRIRDAIFVNEQLKHELEACLHPLIAQQFDQQTAVYQRKNVPYMLWSVPLLLESRRYKDRIDRLLVVDTPVEVQRTRVLARGVSPEVLAGILASQVSRSVRQAEAQDIIINTGSMESIGRIVGHLHRYYLQWAGRKPL